MRSLRAIEHEGNWRLPATPQAVREMRANVRRLLEQHRVDPVASADIPLAVSEAVANSVVHAYPDGQEPGPVEVRAQVLDSSVVITVSDEGVGMSPRPGGRGLGIGLPLIGRLASSVDIRSGSDNGGSGIRMTFKVPELAGPSPATRERDRVVLLDEVSELSESVHWPDQGYGQLLDALVPRLADACAIDLLSDEPGLKRRAVRVAGPGGEEIAALLKEWPLHPRAQVRTLASRQASVTRIEPETLHEVAVDEEGRRLLARMGLRYWVRLPLLDGSRPVGVLALGMRASRPDPRDELDFLRALAERVARGISRARLVAALRDTSERFEEILGRLTTAVTLRDRQGNLLYANDAAVELLGGSSLEEMLSAGLPQLAMRFAFAHEDGTPLTLDRLPSDRLLRGEATEPLVIRSVERVSGRERWVAVRARLVDRDGGLIASISEDVTAAKNAEIRRRLLSGAEQLAALRGDPEEALTELAALVVAGLADWASVHVREGDELRLVALSHPDPTKRERVHELLTRWPPRLDEPGGVGEVIRSGRPQLHAYLTEDLLRECARDPDHLHLMHTLVLRSQAIVPIGLPDGRTAALALATADSWRRFDRGQLGLASEVVALAAAALGGGPAEARDVNELSS